MANVRKAAGEGNVRARPRAREKRGEERVLLPHSSRALHAFQVHKISFSFPLEHLARRLDYLSNSTKWNVFIRNVEILVKPLHYLHSIFVLFLACQFSLLQCVMHYVQILSIIFLNKQDWTPYVRSLTEKFPYSLTISIYPMQLFAALPFRVRL